MRTLTVEKEPDKAFLNHQTEVVRLRRSVINLAATL